jgi:hypothetical protein
MVVVTIASSQSLVGHFKVPQGPSRQRQRPLALRERPLCRAPPSPGPIDEPPSRWHHTQTSQNNQHGTGVCVRLDQEVACSTVNPTAKFGTSNREQRKRAGCILKSLPLLSLSLLNVFISCQGVVHVRYLYWCTGSKALTDIPSAGTKVAKGTVHLFGTIPPLSGTAKSKSVWSPFASKASLPSTKYTVFLLAGQRQTTRSVATAVRLKHTSRVVVVGVVAPISSED